MPPHRACMRMPVCQSVRGGEAALGARLNGPCGDSPEGKAHTAGSLDSANCTVQAKPAAALQSSTELQDVQKKRYKLFEALKEKVRRSAHVLLCHCLCPDILIASGAASRSPSRNSKGHPQPARSSGSESSGWWLVAAPCHCLQLAWWPVDRAHQTPHTRSQPGRATAPLAAHADGHACALPGLSRATSRKHPWRSGYKRI